MEYIQAIILGIIQGLTEFLPISSSAHLMLVPHLTGWKYFGKYFDVAVHIGTFAALLVYYRFKVVELFKNFIKSFKNFKEIKNDHNLQLPWLLIASAFPAGVVGVLFENIIETKLSIVWVTASILIIFGILLAISESISSGKLETKNIDLKTVLIIGCCQAIALIPGVSRSGITMTACMFLGMKKDESANFSFLMSLPVVGGAAIFAVLRIIKDPSIMSSLWIFLFGIIASAISGYFVIKFLLDFLKKGSFQIFMYYRIALGLLILGMVFWGAI